MSAAGRHESAFTQERIVIGITMVLVLAFSVMLDAFLTPGNLLSLLQNVSILGILGVAMALVLGKPLGVVGVSWAVVRLGWCRLPPGVSWGGIGLIGLLAGIGFTMSIFIAMLAFEDETLLGAAKLGVLAGSLAAALLGLAWGAVYRHVNKTGQ